MNGTVFILNLIFETMKIEYTRFWSASDDVELGCGGTIAKLISEGKKCAIIDLTKGELGTRGTDANPKRRS